MAVVGATIALGSPAAQALVPAVTATAPTVLAPALAPPAPDASMTVPGWDARFGLQGAGGRVLAVAYAGADAYVGGDFTTVAGLPANSTPYVAHWTGQGFVPMGAGVDGEVEAVAVIGSKVYIGGKFTHAGGLAARHLAVWDGATWAAVGGGVSTDPAVPVAEDVAALATDGTHLFVGGQFDHAGTTPAQSVASFDPSTGAFAALGAGIRKCAQCGTTQPGLVRVLMWSSGRLYVGGTFDEAGTGLTGSLASWTVAGWTTYGAGVLTSSGYSGAVSALALDPSTGTVYVGGYFDLAGGFAAKSAAQLVGTTWSPLEDFTDTFGATGAQSGVQALAVVGGALYAGGQFLQVGGQPVARLAVRRSGVWTQVDQGVDWPVWSLTTIDANTVAVAGAFDKSGSVALGCLARWNGSSWATFGQGAQQAGNGTPGAIRALAPTATGAYAAGLFDQVGGVPANSIARWDASGWHALGGGITTGGGPGAVNAMAQIGGNLYVAGTFDAAGGQPANNIARWDGSAWHPLAGGLTGGIVHALVAIGGHVYAGGSFSSADITSVSDLAMWDPVGLKWYRVGSNPTYDNGIILSLTAYQTELFIGGTFSSLTTGSTTTPTQNLVDYDTTNTSTAAQAGYQDFGGVDGQVTALAVTGNGDLYVGGAFSHANTGQGRTSIQAADIAVWHGGAIGTWGALGAGVTGPGPAIPEVDSLAIVGATLYVGGTFAAAGGSPAPAVASYTAAGGWLPMGAGFALPPNSGTLSVLAMAQSDSSGLFVGGHFVTTGTTPAGSISLWPATVVAPGVPAAPTILKAIGGNRAASLTWTTPAANVGGPVTAFVVTPFVGAVAQAPVTFNSIATTQTIAGLVNATTYTFVVAAVNVAGTGSPSMASSQVTVGAPAAPVLVSAQPGNGSAKVSWWPAAANGSPVTGYVITPYAGTVALAATTFNSTVAAQTINGLTNGTTYTFRIAAINAFGTGAQSIATSPVKIGTPAAPALPTAQPGNGSAKVSWSAAVANASPVTGYVVTPYAGTVALAATTFNSTAVTQTIGGLTNGTTYTFRIAAVNAVGSGPQSITTAITVGTPMAPVLASAQPGNGSAKVVWWPTAANGSPITGYVITPYAGTVALAATTFNSTAANETIIGLTNGTVYTFRIAAINGVGTGPAATAAAVTVGAPTAPTAVVATAGAGQANVSWAAGADNGSAVSGYKVTPYKSGVALATITFDATATMRNITGLVAGASYTFRVSAVNIRGTGPQSAASGSVTPT